MGNQIELDLTPKELEELEEFLHLGIQMASGMGKNSNVLRKLMYGVLKRVPENHGLRLTPDNPGVEAVTAYVVCAKNAETPQEVV